MAALTPVRLYGLKVEAGADMPVAAYPDDDFIGPLRITMAAIDPNAAPQLDETLNGSTPRATLKILRVPIEDDDEDDDDYDEDDEDDEDEDDDDDIDAIERRLGGAIADDDDDDEESSDDEDEKNGGPSDPSKSKKARKAAAVEQLLEALKNATDDMEEDAPNGVNGTKLNKGKSKASDEDEDETSDMEDDDATFALDEFVLCTLDPEKHYQQPLDITITENEAVFFMVTGTHDVYLTGNYVEPPQDPLTGRNKVDLSDYFDDEYDTDEEEEEEDSEEESDELDDIDDPRIMELDSDEEPPKLVKAADKKGKNKRPAEDSDEEAGGLDDLIKKSLKPTEAATNGESQSKRQAKKLKNNAGQPVAGADEKPTEKAASAKSDKKVQFAKNLEQGPTGSPVVNTKKDTKTESKKEEKQEKKDEKSAKPSLGLKTIAGGIKIDDRKLGSGPGAKNGDKVSMRYIGKLEKDNKVFDSNKKGKPFSFALGKGQVIKGWDLGIAGMQVGGERRIIIPAAMGYGSKSMPGIPGNSTLVFDVKMLSLN